ncbi:MAG: hypothetical protein E4H25_03310, partial [Methanomassiliicoccus sp.]
MAEAHNRLMISWVALVFAAIVLTGPLSSSSSGETPEFMQIIEIDNYAKEVHAGESVLYNWT